MGFTVTKKDVYTLARTHNLTVEVHGYEGGFRDVYLVGTLCDLTACCDDLRESSIYHEYTHVTNHLRADFGTPFIVIPSVEWDD